MTEHEIIKKLQDKNYVRAFGLMEETLPGSQAVYRKVGRENCVYFSHDERWEKLNKAVGEFYSEFTYAIKPDYQPEPEYVDLEIKENGGWLGAWDRIDIKMRYNFTHLHCLPSLPNFMFFWKDDNGYKVHNEIYSIGQIAMMNHYGATIYARMRK